VTGPLRRMYRAVVPPLVRYRLWEWRTLPLWLYNSHRHGTAERLAALKDRHRGERCFLLGNGPSLRTMDLSPLRDEVTIGLNRIYLLFEEMGFSTTYLVAINQLVLEQFATDLRDVDTVRFVSAEARQLFPNDPATIPLRCTPRPHFSKRPFRGVWPGATVTFVGLQLAYHMGFHQVILIGVDHTFTTKGEPHRTVTSGGADPNHFSPEYFGSGVRWQLPDLETSEVAYTMARSAFEADGREVVDATVGGRLEVFRKVRYEDVVG
jgi:hypothetical protein